jgi:hypothetical protein
MFLEKTMADTIKTSDVFDVKISMIEGVTSMVSEIDASASFVGQPFQQIALGPLGGVFMRKKLDEVSHFEVPHNKDGKIYDEAVKLIDKFCDSQDFSGIHSLKFHTNTWGLSSCNAFADNYIPKMRFL